MDNENEVLDTEMVEVAGNVENVDGDSGIVVVVGAVAAIAGAFIWEKVMKPIGRKAKEKIDEYKAKKAEEKELGDQSVKMKK